MLSQHALQDQSQVRKARHAIPACTTRPITGQHNLHCIKEAVKAQNSGQADTVK